MWIAFIMAYEKCEFRFIRSFWRIVENLSRKLIIYWTITNNCEDPLLRNLCLSFFFRPSFCQHEKNSATGRFFIKLVWSSFKLYVEKLEELLISDESKGYFNLDNSAFLFKTRIFCSVKFFCNWYM